MHGSENHGAGSLNSIFGRLPWHSLTTLSPSAHRSARRNSQSCCHHRVGIHRRPWPRISKMRLRVPQKRDNNVEDSPSSPPRPTLLHASNPVRQAMQTL